MSDKKEAQADAPETKEKEETEKPKKTEKKQKKVKESKPAAESAKTKTTKKAKKTKKTAKKVVKKKVTKASEEKTKSTKTKTTTKPKKTVKPAKKAVKKTETKSKKATTEKKTTTTKKKSASKKVHKYEEWILEAIVSLSTEDKPYVSYEKIKTYLISYMDGSIAATIPHQTRKTLDKLHEKGLLKKKKESYALTVSGKKVAPTTIEKRKKIAGREEKPKKTQKIAIEPVEFKEIVTNTGRTSRQRVI